MKFYVCLSVYAHSQHTQTQMFACICGACVGTCRDLYRPWFLPDSVAGKGMKGAGKGGGKGATMCLSAASSRPNLRTSP